MKVGDLIKFSQTHWERPGLDYCKDWIGILVDQIFDSEGEPKELYIFWRHNKGSDYPSSWWDRLSYFPFIIISDGGYDEIR